MASFFVDKLCGLKPFHIFSAVGRRVFRGRWLRVVFLVFLFTAGSASTLMWAQSDFQQRGLLASTYVLQALSPPFLIVIVPKDPPLIIVDTEVWANGSRTLSQDLVVQSGGALFLVNYTLSMNCTSFNQYGITVEGGGSLYVQDVDFNSSTGADASVIKAVDGGCSYTFRVEKGAVFQMLNSEVHHCGYVPWISPPRVGQGLTVEADYTVIQGSRFTANAHGFVLSNCDYNVIMDNYFSDNYYDGIFLNYSDYNYIIGNTAEKNAIDSGGPSYFADIRLFQSNSNTISGNDLLQSIYWFAIGIRVTGSSNNNTVENNSVYFGQWGGIAVYSSQYNVIHHNVVFKTRWWGVEVKASDNTFTENIVNENGRGFMVHGDSDRNNFTNNTANGNEIGFMLYGDSQYDTSYNVFLRNIAEQNTGSGFYVQGLYINFPPYYGYWTNFNRFENNTAQNNTNGFTVLINSEQNNFTGNFLEDNDVGFELNSAKNNIFNNNTVVGSDYGYRLLEGSSGDQFVGETLEDNRYQIYLNESVNTTFLSSTLKNCLVEDLCLNNSSELNLFNTSFSTLNIDSTSTLNIKNYLRIRVVDSLGTPLPNTDVKVISSGGILQETVYATVGYGGSDPRTDGGGYTPWFLVTNATYQGSITPVLRMAQVYVQIAMVNFPDIPVTVELIEPQTLTISGMSVLLPLFVLSGLMNTGGSSAPLYAGIVGVSLVALAGVAVYFLRFRK